MKHGTAAVLVFLCCAAASFGQSEQRPWEKYGLSQSEWKLVMENRIPLDKVRTLLSAGIAIPEYCARPWERLGLLEGEWVEKRRAGLTSYDIELEAKAHRRRHVRTDTAATGPSGYSTLSSAGNQLISFVLPGFQQFRLNQPVRARFMTGLAVASLAACFAGAVVEDRFEPRPLYFVLAPDMLWSLIDFKITLAIMNKRK